MKPDSLKDSHLLPIEQVDASSLILYYLQQLQVEYVFGVPGGAIEPFYNALARSQREGGPKAVVARHECGAVFMADGYSRNSGKLGVCCSTTGPGATNLITGIASAYENQVPLLVITAQTALKNFGRRALQDSADTGINIIGMMQYCTRYNSMVTHVDQLEQKLVSAIVAAMKPPYGPAHLSIPIDILKSNLSSVSADYPLSKLVAPPSYLDTDAVAHLVDRLMQSSKIVFVLGGGAVEAAALILAVAGMLNAEIVTTPDGKGLVSPRHPQYRGVIGFAGHESAQDAVKQQDVDLIIVVGAIINEWTTNGWDRASLLNDRLVHIDSVPTNLAFSPMAGLHVQGCPRAVFERVLDVYKHSAPLTTGQNVIEVGEDFARHHIKFNDADAFRDSSAPIKPQWLMHILSQRFPPNCKFLADAGNSLAWAIHYLHPIDRRISERRNRPVRSRGRRKDTASLFQCTIEFAPMGWAIGNAIGVALAQPGCPVVCITGDGSVLMNGQEMSVAAELNLPVIFVILNDGALGMVKHGQRLAGAEPIGFKLPQTNFAKLAQSMGIEGIRIEQPEDLLALDFMAISKRQAPLILDVVIDPEAVPPLGSRIKVLNNIAN